MNAELLAAVRGYLRGDLSRDELAGEVTSFDWNDCSPEADSLHPAVGMLELVIEEVSEGLRDEAELKVRARELLSVSSVTR